MERRRLSHAEAGRLGAAVSSVLKREQKKKRIEEYEKNPHLCKACKKSLEYSKRHNKFCSHSCSATFNNARVWGNQGKIRISSGEAVAEAMVRKTQQNCKNCGKPIKARRTFCSVRCQQAYYWQSRKNKIEAEGKFEAAFGGEAHRPFVKRYLTEKYGHKCSICGTTEWCGKPVPLVVDHIDGDSTNNTVANFRLVCGNCDMQLPTYKSKNKHGRAWRRKYNK